MSSTPTSDGNTVALWNFNDASTTTWVDSGPNGITLNKNVVGTGTVNIGTGCDQTALFLTTGINANWGRVSHYSYYGGTDSVNWTNLTDCFSGSAFTVETTLKIPSTSPDGLLYNPLYWYYDSDGHVTANGYYPFKLNFIPAYVLEGTGYANGTNLYVSNYPVGSALPSSGTVTVGSNTYTYTSISSDTRGYYFVCTVTPTYFAGQPVLVNGTSYASNRPYGIVLLQWGYVDIAINTASWNLPKWCQDGQFHVWAIEFTNNGAASSVSLYVDSFLIGTVTGVPAVVAPNGSHYSPLETQIYASSVGTNGMLGIDSTRLSNVARSLTDLNTFSLANMGRISGDPYPMGYWRFDDWAQNSQSLWSAFTWYAADDYRNFPSISSPTAVLAVGYGSSSPPYLPQYTGWNIAGTTGNNSFIRAPFTSAQRATLDSWLQNDWTVSVWVYNIFGGATPSGNYPLFTLGCFGSASYVRSLALYINGVSANTGRFTATWTKSAETGVGTGSFTGTNVTINNTSGWNMFTVTKYYNSGTGNIEFRTYLNLVNVDALLTVAGSANGPRMPASIPGGTTPWITIGGAPSSALTSDASAFFSTGVGIDNATFVGQQWSLAQITNWYYATSSAPTAGTPLYDDGPPYVGYIMRGAGTNMIANDSPVLSRLTPSFLSAGNSYLDYQVEGANIAIRVPGQLLLSNGSTLNGPVNGGWPITFDAAPPNTIGATAAVSVNERDIKITLAGSGGTAATSYLRQIIPSAAAGTITLIFWSPVSPGTPIIDSPPTATELTVQSAVQGGNIYTVVLNVTEYLSHLTTVSPGLNTVTLTFDKSVVVNSPTINAPTGNVTITSVPNGTSVNLLMNTNP